MNIKDDNLEDLLVTAGYKQHFIRKGSFVEETYVRNRSNSRFHLVFNKDDNGILCKKYGHIHIDVFKKHKHKVLKDKNLLKKELEYIKSFKPKVIPPPPKEKKEKSTIPRKGIFAPDWKELTKTKVIKRSWWNPMRYIKGKFIYIKK